MTKILLDKPYASLVYVAEGNYLKLTWKADIDNESYKDLWNFVLNQFIVRQINRLLIDQRELGNISMAARAWFMVKFVPTIRKQVTGTIVLAMIQTKHVGRKAAFAYLINGAKNKLNLKLEKFNDPEEAKNWIVIN
ncbi:MAG: hypothetical protein JJT94_01390 [Bernardetiaceae bacterium]|nr:hypothetical protein [Bernardetiaceae bacterium]